MKSPAFAPCVFAVVAVGSAALSSSHAAWTVVDTMEGANNWNGGGTLVADPEDGSNTVYAQARVTSGISGYLDIPDIADGTTGTLFFRIRSTENAGLVDWVAGASDMATPSGFGDFEGYMRLAENGEVGNIDIDVRNTAAAGGFSEVGDADSDVWYNVWLVLDNSADVTDAYFNISGDATAAGTSSFLGGTFRNGTTDSLTNLLAINNENNTTAYLDDIYIDLAGQNLTNPVPEASTLLLVAACGLGGILRRRR